MIRLYDSASGSKKPFAPINKDEVTIYICGPTVYDDPHLGNARPAVVFGLLVDILARHYKVKYVRNVTDIDDKIIAKAATQNIPPKELAEQMLQRYKDNMDALGARPPDAEPKATEHMDDIHALITTLLAKNFAYKAHNHIVFDTAAYEPYGSLSNRTEEEATQAGARVEVAKWKKEPKDFILWKPAKEGEPAWKPPAQWGLEGAGRPGWHIECSAMCQCLLGEVVDIHGGGIDLLFPHHENEQAQSCAAFGSERLANFWLHNGHITKDGSKMAKSLGNVVTVSQLLEQYPAEVLRYFLLASHYRRPCDWNERAALMAKKSLDGWYRLLLNDASLNDNSLNKDSLNDASLNDASPSAEPDSEFIAALEDDLNTPKALSILHTLEKTPAILKASANLLGLLKVDAAKWFEGDQDVPAIEAQIAQRTAAKKAGDYKKADEIRNQLEQQLGVILEDSSTGTIWRKK